MTIFLLMCSVDTGTHRFVFRGSKVLYRGKGTKYFFDMENCIVIIKKNSKGITFVIIILVQKPGEANTPHSGCL